MNHKSFLELFDLLGALTAPAQAAVRTLLCNYPEEHLDAYHALAGQDQADVIAFLSLGAFCGLDYADVALTEVERHEPPFRPASFPLPDRRAAWEARR